jgi:hypothetical protein
VLTHSTFREHILILYISLRGVAEAALYCAHRADHVSIVHFPSLLVISQEWGLIDLLLRASNEGLLRPRVARAQEINSLHSPTP